MAWRVVFICLHFRIPPAIISSLLHIQLVPTQHLPVPTVNGSCPEDHHIIPVPSTAQCRASQHRHRDTPLTLPRSAKSSPSSTPTEQELTSSASSSTQSHSARRSKPCFTSRSSSAMGGRGSRCREMGRSLFVSGQGTDSSRLFGFGVVMREVSNRDAFATYP